MNNRLHLGVYGLVIQEEAVLLVKKTRGPYTGKWDLPGGRLEHGEEIHEALTRELLEETGLAVESYSFLSNKAICVDYIEKDQPVSLYHIGLIYRVYLAPQNQENIIIMFEDVSEAQWFQVAKIQKNSLSPLAGYALDVALSSNG